MFIGLALCVSCGLVRQLEMVYEWLAAVLDANDSDEAASRPPPSAAFAAQLTEVAWQWTTTALAPDLEAFSRHAKRAKISVEDVILATRKNEATQALVEREAAKLKTKRPRSEK